MGYVDIGGVRYMDLREINNFFFPVRSLLFYDLGISYGIKISIRIRLFEKARLHLA